MKPGHLIFIPAVLVAILIVQCRHEPDKIPITGDPCHPDTVYFERDIMPLLNSSCAKSGCHDAASATDGIILDNYANVMAKGDIKPGNPDDSDLYEVITDNDPLDRMPPPPVPPLSAEQIAMVRKWIQQGAQNLTCDDE